MKKKYIIVFIALLGIIFYISNTPKVKQYFAEDGYYKILEKAHLIKKCFQPMQDFKEIFDQEGFNYNESNKAIILASLNKLNLDTKEDQLRIPTITHHIYFTNDSKTLNDFYLEKMKANFNKLNSFKNQWQHYIWTNTPEIFSDELKQIQGVKIKNITELEDNLLYQNLINTLNQGMISRAYFAEASDILRFMVVQKFGGIYQDMDYEIYNAEALINLMKKFNFIGGRETINQESYYGSAFFAARANHPILNDVIQKKHRNLDYIKSPDYIKHACYSHDIIYFNSPPLLTIAYFAKNNLEGNSDIILPSWMIFNKDFARFKNKTCDYKKITKADFNRNNDNLISLLTIFKTNFQQSDNITDDNIYYSNKNSPLFNIIGADMFCGNWYDNNHNRKLDYDWNLPWSK